jgi:hypothetical protein
MPVHTRIIAQGQEIQISHGISLMAPVRQIFLLALLSVNFSLQALNEVFPSVASAPTIQGLPPEIRIDAYPLD